MFGEGTFVLTEEQRVEEQQRLARDYKVWPEPTTPLLHDVEYPDVTEGALEAALEHAPGIDHMNDVMLEYVQSSEREMRVAKGAQLCRDIMMEFEADGEAFLPHEDAQLNLWLRDTIRANVSGISPEAVDYLIREIEGFPAVVRVRKDYELAS